MPLSRKDVELGRRAENNVVNLVDAIRLSSIDQIITLRLNIANVFYRHDEAISNHTALKLPSQPQQRIGIVVFVILFINMNVHLLQNTGLRSPHENIA